MDKRRSIYAAIVVSAIAALGLHWSAAGVHGLIACVVSGVIAAGLYSVLYFFGEIPARDVISTGVVAAVGGPASLPYLVLFTAFAGSVIAMLVMARYEKASRFARATIREAAHAPQEELVMAPPLATSPIATLRRHYGSVITLGAVLTLLQIVLR